MVAEYIEEIEERVDAFAPQDRNLPLYFPDFGAPPAAGDLHRVFGGPVGIAAHQWPDYPRLAELLHRAGQEHLFDAGDLRMEHVLTLDLRRIKVPSAPAEAAAMLLFISHVDAHHAHQNGNTDTHVIFVGPRALEEHTAVHDLPRRSRARWSRRFSLRQIDVPGDVFDPDHEDDSPMGLLRDAIWQAPARIGGVPMWVREPNDPRDYIPTMTPARRLRGSIPGRNTFIMQFDRSFAPVHLGHEGVMYVSGTGAYYQDYPRPGAPMHATHATHGAMAPVSPARTTIF